MTTGVAAAPDPMKGKTCVVTGATAGIGEVTALELARRGATLVLVGRNPTKIEATREKIRRGAGGSEVEFHQADLSSQAEVRKLAADVAAKHPRIHVLVNNAGAMFDTRQETVDGIERTWALNHLSYFLLTTLLLDNLKAAAPSRVVCVSSDAHRMASGIDFADPEAKVKTYRPFQVYSQSKLANILFAAELAGRLSGTGVTANSLHPGVVKSEFSKDKTRGVGLALNLITRVIGISPEKGAETSVYLATSPDVEHASGGYYSKSAKVTPRAPARDAEAGRRLWALSEQQTARSV